MVLRVFKDVMTTELYAAVKERQTVKRVLRGILALTITLLQSVALAATNAPYAHTNYSQPGSSYPANTYSSNSYANGGSYPSSFHVDDQFASYGINPNFPVDYNSTNHSINDFHPEWHDVFHLMDQVADTRGHLHPLDFGNVPAEEDQNNQGQQAIYGRNTWMMWCAGDEFFWDWLSQNGYGVLDFLKMLDSRKRESRFHDLGLINQPGLKRTEKPGPYGLYLDTVDKRIGETDDYHPFPNAKPARPTDPNTLEGDGVNPAIYGYPSGVIGLRLFPNPKFDDAAKKWWNAEAFYGDPNYSRDPRTVRPFLVGASCALCHVSPHPLNPPANPEEPAWANLSSIIGNQYFRTSGTVGTAVERGNFLWFFLASQQPGTTDTSMVATDNIDNPNTMNAVFELPARLHRAELNPPEIQEQASQSLPPVGVVNRPVPRVLVDGADSIGVFGALARVYLNIGTYHLEWNECNNPVIGFAPQKPFSLGACRSNSVYWRVDENFRVNYLAAFFEWETNVNSGHGTNTYTWNERSTAAMHLKDALAPLDSLNISLITDAEPFDNGKHEKPSIIIRNSSSGPEIKIFDGKGNTVTNADMTSFNYKTNEIQTLKSLINSLKSEGELSGDAKQRVYDAVVALTGYAPKYIELPTNGNLWNQDLINKGGDVFVKNCAVCHSSKQPEGFAIQFSHNPPEPAWTWENVTNDGVHLTMPLDWDNWEAFKKSPSYQSYVGKIVSLAGDGDTNKFHAFIEQNFLSTDIRIPVSLTQTPAGRALATNGKSNQVWAEFTSETYKALPPVGPITYYDPFSKTEKSFQPTGNGPGYYRPASLVSVWATAPLLHNNALGMYIPDSDEARRVSVEGRLAMFDDAIEKLLWKDKRNRTPSGEAGLRTSEGVVWHGKDPGWIFRTDIESELRIPQGHLRHLVTGVLPGFLPPFLCKVVMALLDHPWITPLALLVLAVVLMRWAPPFYFYFISLTAAGAFFVIPFVGLQHLFPWEIWVGPIALLLAAILWMVYGLESGPRTGTPVKTRWPRHSGAWVAFTIHLVFIVGVGIALWGAHEFVNGHLGDLRAGPLPKGIPVNSLMNINPEAGILKLSSALRGLTSAIGKLRANDRLPVSLRLSDEERLAIFEKDAGPALMAASKCPDFVLDRGHYFGESLTDDEKRALIAFLKTL